VGERRPNVWGGQMLVPVVCNTQQTIKQAFIDTSRKTRGFGKELDEACGRDRTGHER
jgi:hypothetical protein